MPPPNAISHSATASPPSLTSCTPATSRARTSSATSACSRTAASRSATGGAPPSRPCTTAAHSDPPSSARVSPSTTIDSPASSRDAGRRGAQVVDQAEHADDRRRVDVGAARRVVEGDVAADHRDPERFARLAHPVDHLGELPHHLGVLRVAEVEAVHERERPRAGARDVARRFEHHEPRADARVEVAEARLAVGRERERLGRALHAQHRGVGARAGDRREEQLVVVLARHPRLVGDRRRREQREQLAAEVGAERELGARAAARDRRPAARPARAAAPTGRW